MQRVLLWLAPLALFAGQARYARLGDFAGQVEVQLQAADAWMPAERNLPLSDSTWLRTAAGAHAEIEFDDGNAFRLSADSQMELSDYTRLSTGQRLTVVSLDHGVGYFTGEPNGRDNVTLVAPGAQITLIAGTRVRLTVDVTATRVAVIEGKVRLSCPAAEIDLNEGQTGFVDPTNPVRFSLERGVKALESDAWSEVRDKALTPGATHVAQRYGANDLETNGEWVMTDVGAAWKPKVADTWAPFQNGRWRWYDGLGYTWVGNEPWAWLPYHYGRWTNREGLGWLWVPGAPNSVFKPGDAYWVQGQKIAGWGPLAPGEIWDPSGTPQQFRKESTTYAYFTADARVIDPSDFRGPVVSPVYTLALPSPAFPASRLDAVRPILRVGSTRMDLVIPGTTFEDTSQSPPPAEVPPIVPVDPDASGPVPPPATVPAGVPVPVIYPQPAYTGVVVINSTDHPPYAKPASTVAPKPVPAPKVVERPRETPREPQHPTFAPSAPSVPHVEAPKPAPAPAPKEVKAETKTETKTDTPAKKQ